MRRLARAGAIALLLVPLLPPVARGGEYDMPTLVQYLVDPAAGQIGVTVEVNFTNTLANPPGQISGFDHIDLAIQAGASQVAAADASGALSISLTQGDGAQIASVKPRARVRYNQTVSFTLSYALADGATPDVHVRSRVVKFAAWGFGTASQVTVELPAEYDVRADGDPMLIEEGGAVLRLTSGPIPDPDRWLALVTGVNPSGYVTRSASVALASGTVDLQVRSWSDDLAWGDRTLAFLVEALPSLEEVIGLPYPRVGPLVVSEAAGGEASTGEALSPSAEIQVAFDGTPFTLLHQAAHIWISDQLAADRWIREGLASHYAARVAELLGVETPYDPVVRVRDLAADATPLVGWGVIAQGSAADSYGYAASWAFVNVIAGALGETHLATVLQRIVAGVSAYDPLEPVAVDAGGRPFAPVDTRRLLDQMTAVGSVDLGDLFVNVALGQDAALEMAERGIARDEYQALVGAAGDWGAPDPIRAAMAAWRFDEARSAIAEASAWLAKRDALIARVAAAGLVTPDRLRDRFVVAGGGPDARAELEAERAVVDAYLDVRELAAGASGPLDRIGLFAGDDPRRLLADAGASFAAGDLRAAAATLDQLELQLNRAAADGAVRLASGAVLAALIGLGVGVSIRRRRGSHYTAAA